MSGLVIAALGFQLLLCSAASAAHACSGTIDRIPSSVAQAFREIVDRHAINERSARTYEPGYRLADCSLTQPSSAKIEQIVPTARIAGNWILNLPPPLI
jgi:hypothetical protein